MAGGRGWEGVLIGIIVLPLKQCTPTKAIRLTDATVQILFANSSRILNLFIGSLTRIVRQRKSNRISILFGVGLNFHFYFHFMYNVYIYIYICALATREGTGAKSLCCIRFECSSSHRLSHCNGCIKFEFNDK